MFLVAPFSPRSQTLGMPESVNDHRMQASEKKVFNDLDAYFGNMSLYGAQLPMQSPIPSAMRTGLHNPQSPQWSNSYSNSRQSSQASLPGHQNIFTRLTREAFCRRSFDRWKESLRRNSFERWKPEFSLGLEKDARADSGTDMGGDNGPIIVMA